MRDFLPIFLLAFAGFLAGGTYAMWKTARGLAVVLAVAALVALAGGLLWL
ncbi:MULTISPECIES: hypothetical protein [Actinopolyspora]|uniref:Uncharacterized protein n=1 Tax=Actinopolyspora saharensis TaxID=995062 RepID=A0A1H1AP69_9ACTN|nr:MULTISPECIES: hypothetical protein [Actinopolyspora]NHD17083.1 hypothetical protein [Actinopolyspora sp. BKK2]NHE76235.1 hypothetical protein [Actinopolyspora sp. BKK1]SDQ41553.1 hypothetical protein SAMN04489718_1675 [Actinopolyspora saharensis]